MQAHELAILTAVDAAVKTVVAADATLDNLRAESVGGLVGARKTLAADLTLDGKKRSKVLVEIKVHEVLY